MLRQDFRRIGLAEIVRLIPQAETIFKTNNAINCSHPYASLRIIDDVADGYLIPNDTELQIGFISKIHFQLETCRIYDESHVHR